MNYLVSAVVTRRVRVPLIWSVIEGRGCSDTGMRFALIERYLAHFQAKTIRLLLADREFVGADCLEFLCKNNVPFAMRMRDNLRITREDGHDLTLQARRKPGCARPGATGPFALVLAPAKTWRQTMPRC